MDQENQHQTIVPYTINATGFWPSKLARFISLPITRLTSSTLNNYRVFIDDDFVGGVSAADGSGGDSYSAELLEECFHGRPFMVLEVLWNLAFVVAAVFVVLTTIKERPFTPLRLWVTGYALQCLLHLGFVWIDYRISLFYHRFHAHSFSFMRRLESFTTLMSTVWWLLGLYWVVIGGQDLLQDSPRLYWLSVIYLAFDLFSMIFCIGMACIMFIAVFCCFPILAAVAYAITTRGGASVEDIHNLPKYKYNDLTQKQEDSECCICLHEYEDGAELCNLPCHHHFHYPCIRKWLRINATCPLCKCDMFRGEMLV